MRKAAALPRNDGIRSVERAIDILQALNRRPLSTLGELHGETGLPKPSIVRLLRTLEAKKLVAKAPSYGSYQLLGAVKSLASGYHHQPQVVQAAEERMVEFTAREGWPLALAMLDLDAVEVHACTIRHTSLSLEHSSLNRRLSMVTRALGRAYLAFSPPGEQAILRDLIAKSDDPEDASASTPAAIDQIIAEVRQHGYAARAPHVDPRSSTIAVPILENGRAIASLGVTWITAAMSRRDAVYRYLPPLVETAAQIARSVEQDRSSALAAAGSA